MKQSAILGILNGVRGYRETMNMPMRDKENARIICDTYDKLEEKLSPELLDLHQKLVDALRNSWSEEIDFHFVEGFKLGVLIGIECMEN